MNQEWSSGEPQRVSLAAWLVILSQSRRQGAGVPGCRGAGVPGCQGARVPGCRGAGVPEVPGCRGAGVPGCRRAGVPVAGLPGCSGAVSRSPLGRLYTKPVPTCRGPRCTAHYEHEEPMDHEGPIGIGLELCASWSLLWSPCSKTWRRRGWRCPDVLSQSGCRGCRGCRVHCALAHRSTAHRAPSQPSTEHRAPSTEGTEH